MENKISLKPLLGAFLEKIKVNTPKKYQFLKTYICGIQDGIQQKEEEAIDLSSNYLVFKMALNLKLPKVINIVIKFLIQLLTCGFLDSAQENHT